METGTCISCTIFGTWQQAADGYAQTVNANLSPYAMPFLAAVLAFFWTFRIMAYMAGKQVDFADLGKEVVLTGVASTFLTFPSMWMVLLAALLDTAVNLARFLVDPEAVTVKSGITGLLEAISQPLNQIVSAGRALMAGTGWSELALFLGALVLYGLYGVLWFLITIDAVWFYTKFIVLQVLGPIVLVALATPATRGLAAQAYKLVLTAILEFATLGIIIGLSSYMLKLALSHMPVDDSGSVLSDAADFLFSIDYLTALFCGGLLIFLRSGFKHIAAQLANAVADSAPSLSIPNISMPKFGNKSQPQ